MKINIILCITFLAFQVCAQKNVKILNGSFEGIPQRGMSDNDEYLSWFDLENWFDCGFHIFKGESPPDLHPHNLWGNTQKPSDGETYIGMVVRDNLSFESIGQKLSQKLDTSKCYKIAIDLSKAAHYLSRSRLNDKSADFTNACVLRIWSGNAFCKSQEMLAQSTLVNHYSWKTYQFKIHPKYPYRYIILEAYYKSDPTNILVYNGNILVDNLQDLIEIDCNEKVDSIISK
jgi:hypothetical protein